GKMTKERHTYTGVYYIIEKRYDTYLKGATWNTHVMYFALFNFSGQGFHDATWRSRFGGNIYVNGGSHGCVNMPYSNAEALYSKLEPGTPVVIY
nr:L,D-transpeptidase [Lachnospiraceae bacterium]